VINDDDVARAMRHRGGSFVAKLGELWQLADGVNQARIKAAWPEYWQTYTRHAQQMAEPTMKSPIAAWQDKLDKKDPT
jgi:hypothetical protein